MSPLGGVVHTGYLVVVVGDVALKVLHSEMNGCHMTPLGVAGFSVPCVLTLDSVMLGLEEEADKKILKNMTLVSVAAVDGCCMMNNWTYLRRKGWWALLVSPPQYSPSRHSKKKAIQVRSLMKIIFVVVAWVEVSMYWMKLTGRGLTLVWGGLISHRQ